jgi:hypothetical protein
MLTYFPEGDFPMYNTLGQILERTQALAEQHRGKNISPAKKKTVGEAIDLLILMVTTETGVSRTAGSDLPKTTPIGPLTNRAMLYVEKLADTL